MQARTPGWFYFLVPYYATQEITVNVIPLYVLYLKGTVVDVGYASALYSIVPIFSSIVIGRLADITGRRKVFLYAASGIMVASLAAMYLERSVLAVILAYTFFSLGASVAVPVFGLLLTETLPRSMWGRGNTKSFTLMLTGYILGMLPTIFLVKEGNILYSFYSAIAFGLGAIALAAFMVKEPKLALERRSEIRDFNAFIHRILKWPAITLRAPRLSDFKVLRGLYSGATRDLSVITAAAALFFFATNMFFTSYSPFLVKNDVAYWLILSVNTYILFINSIGMIGPIRRLVEQPNPALVDNMLLIRTIGALVASIASSYLLGMRTFYATFVVFTILGLAYTPIYVGIYSLLYYNLPSTNQGAVLGVYSAIVNASLFLGSLLSGYASFYLGYTFTFFLSAIVFLTSAVVLEWHYRIHERE